MLTFTPVARGDEHATLSYADLCNRYDYAGPFTHLKAALAAGDLAAFVQIRGDSRYWKVPKEHWNRANSSLEGEPADSLFCWGGSNVPLEFRDLPLLFFLDEVESWERDEPTVDVPASAAGNSHNDDWLTSRELLSFNPNATAVESQLHQLFNHGLLRIKARSAKLTVQWKERTEMDWVLPQGNLGDLGAAYKGMAISLRGDSLLVNVRSRQSGTRPESRINAVGLSFGRQDILSAFPEWQQVAKPILSETLPKSGKAGAGAKADKDRWAEFAAGLAVIADMEDGLHGLSIRAIYKKVADLLAGNGCDALDERTVRDAIKLAQAWGKD